MLRTLVVALAALATLSLLERHVWLGALLSELRSQQVLLGALLFGVAVAQRDKLAAPLAFVTTLGLAAACAPLYRGVRPTPAGGPLLRVVHAHLGQVEADHDSLMRWLRERNADVVALTGVAGTLPRAFPAYRISREGSEALLVRDSARNVRFPEDLTGLLSVSLAVGACQVRVVAIDLPSRFDYAGLAPRAKRVAALADVKRVVRSVWLGHLGSRAEAEDLRAFLAAQELRDSRRSHGLLATAPAPLSSLGVPLDHVLVHGWLGVRARDTAPGPTPSSHRAVTATLELTEPACRDEHPKG